MTQEETEMQHDDIVGIPYYHQAYIEVLLEKRDVLKRQHEKHLRRELATTIAFGAVAVLAVVSFWWAL